MTSHRPRTQKQEGEDPGRLKHVQIYGEPPPPHKQETSKHKKKEQANNASLIYHLGKNTSEQIHK